MDLPIQSDSPLTTGMVVPFLIYIVEGLLIFISNMLFFIAIVRRNRLREKYGIVGMEFFVDGTAGLAVLLAGLIRLLRVIFSNPYANSSQRVCLILPYNIMLAWADPMTAIMMLMVSIDRLICIVQPVIYYKRMLSIQKYLALYSNLPILLLIFTSAVCTYRRNNIVSAICWTPDSRCAVFNQIYYGIRISAAASSVILHIIALLIAQRHIRRMKKQVVTSVVDKSQLRFTATAGFSCFATVGLYVLPMIVAFHELGQENFSNFIYTIIIIISNLNSIPKIIIVGWRSQEIRQAVFDLMPALFYRFSKKSITINVIECRGNFERVTHN